MVRGTVAPSTTRAGCLVSGQEDLQLRLPSSLQPGVELAPEQLTVAWAEPAHTHLALAYPIRRG
jgi:hypothetical protein